MRRGGAVEEPFAYVGVRLVRRRREWVASDVAKVGKRRKEDERSGEALGIGRWSCHHDCCGVNWLYLALIRRILNNR